MFCDCQKLKEFRPVSSKNPVTYQCVNCKSIFLARNIDISTAEIVGLQKTDNPFKYYVRVPVKK